MRNMQEQGMVSRQDHDPCKSYIKDQDKVERLKVTKEVDRKETIAAAKIATAFVAVVIVWLYLPSWMPWLY